MCSCVCVAATDCLPACLSEWRHVLSMSRLKFDVADIISDIIHCSAALPCTAALCLRVLLDVVVFVSLLCRVKSRRRDAHHRLGCCCNWLPLLRIRVALVMLRSSGCYETIIQITCTALSIPVIVSSTTSLSKLIKLLLDLSTNSWSNSSNGTSRSDQPLTKAAFGRILANDNLNRRSNSHSEDAMISTAVG